MKSVSRYAVLNDPSPHPPSKLRPGSVPRRSNASREPSPSGPRTSCRDRDGSRSRASLREALRPESDSIRESRRQSNSGGRQPATDDNKIRGDNKEFTSPEVSRIMAKFVERATVESFHGGPIQWSSLQIDFSALEMMIKTRPNMSRWRALDGLFIAQQLMSPDTSDIDGSQQRTFRDLRKFLESEHCSDMEPAEVEAALSFARRVADHFRPYEVQQRERLVIARPTSAPKSGIMEQEKEDPEDRGRTTRRGSFSRAASAVRDGMKKGLRRLSGTTRQARPRASTSRPRSPDAQRPPTVADQVNSRGRRPTLQDVGLGSDWPGRRYSR